jgi:hypothetical protein
MNSLRKNGSWITRLRIYKIIADDRRSLRNENRKDIKRKAAHSISAAAASVSSAIRRSDLQLGRVTALAPAGGCGLVAWQRFARFAGFFSLTDCQGQRGTLQCDGPEASREPDASGAVASSEGVKRSALAAAAAARAAWRLPSDLRKNAR